MRISEILESHQMTLRDGAMVCKAGDWPLDDDKMPESDDVFSPERMDYSLKRVVGHREHLAEIVDKAQADAYELGWLDRNSCGDRDDMFNPYRSES